MTNAVGIWRFSRSLGSNPGEDKPRYRRGGTLRKFAAAAGSAVALAGFAGAANASATIDLIWAATGTNTRSVFSSSAATLRVILTAGPAGAITAGVSVDYSEVLDALVVTGFASKPRMNAPWYLPVAIGLTIDTGTRIENINSSTAPQSGIGLAAGASVRLGTVTFQDSTLLDGTFEIRSDADAPTDGVVDLSGGDISATTTFNSAFVTITGLDSDGDGVSEPIDNCSVSYNTAQDDTDVDDCGNYCDSDYDQTGYSDFFDFGEFVEAFGTTDEEKCHAGVIPGCTVDFFDFGFFVGNFGLPTGPSGSTSGTTACP